MLGITVLLAICVACCAQVPIPQRPPGFAYAGGMASAPVQLEAFLDLMCPDSKAAYPTMKQVAKEYGASTLRFTAHLFPLPYHRTAFISAQGVFVAAETGSDMVWKWMDAIFDQQDDYKMPRTNDMSDTQIIDKLAKVAESIGVSSENFTSQVNNQERMVYEDARVAWKYGCIRGVAGTPWYLLNGVPVNASPNWTVAQWKQIIDSLLKQQGVFVKETINDSSTCPNHEKKCDYLPGKFECCTRGESCIPNVGCRC